MNEENNMNGEVVLTEPADEHSYRDKPVEDFPEATLGEAVPVKQPAGETGVTAWPLATAAVPLLDASGELKSLPVPPVPNKIIAVKDSDDPADYYPPIGTPEAALVISLAGDNFTVIAHTGRFFHGQIGCAGYNGEELGMTGSGDLDLGYYVFENGKPWSYDDDCGIDGDWRPATPKDFIDFDADMPFEPLITAITSFIKENKVSCAEATVEDRVYENAPDLVEELANIVGYYEYPDEVEE